MARAEIHRYELLHVLKVSAGLQRRRSGGRRKKWPTRRPPRYVRALGMVCVLWQWVAHGQFRTNPRAISLKSQKIKNKTSPQRRQSTAYQRAAHRCGVAARRRMPVTTAQKPRRLPPPSYLHGRNHVLQCGCSLLTPSMSSIIRGASQK